MTETYFDYCETDCKYIHSHTYRAVSDTTLAYLAGFFDGEGSIRIVKSKTARGYQTYRLRASVNQVDPAPLLMLRQAFGGSMQLYKRQDKNPKHRDIYSWEVTSVLAIKMLEKLLPFLTVKKTQAEFGIVWAKKNYVLKGKKKTIEDYAALEADKQTLSDMKRVTYGRNS